MKAGPTREEAIHSQDLEDAIVFERNRRIARRIVDAEERPEVEWPESRTLRELLAAPLDPVAWRVEGWLPAGGRVVLAAQAKAGKTTLAANLVRSLVDGAPWLDRDPVTPVTGRVAVIDFEMTERQLIGWYRRLGVEHDDRILMLALRGRAGLFDLRDDDVRARWVKLLRAHDVEFVVWDCLRPVMDALGLDENHDAGLLLTAFDALLTEAGETAPLEAVVVHHFGHTSERARGDSRIVGWGDANWKLVLDEDANEAGPRFVSGYGREVDQRETQLTIEPSTGRLSATGGSRAAVKMAAASEAVVTVLAEAPEPMTVRAIEAAAMGRGVTQAAARQAIQQLRTLNWLEVEDGPNRSLLHRLKSEFAPLPQSQRVGVLPCVDDVTHTQRVGVLPPIGQHTTHTSGEPASGEHNTPLDQRDAPIHGQPEAEAS